MKKILIAGACAGLAWAAQAAPVVVHSNNYTAPSSTLAGVTAVETPAGAVVATAIAPFFATYGNFLRNRTDGTSTLALSNLPAHTTLDINFTALFLDSWDSSNGSPAPDLFQVLVDNVVIASYTVNNASGSVIDFGGGSPVALYTQFDDNIFFSDSVADMSSATALNFAHTASSITIGIRAFGAGLQYGLDESWGIDNLEVVVEASNGTVPEPATYTLVALALLGAAAGARQRKA